MIYSKDNIIGVEFKTSEESLLYKVSSFCNGTATLLVFKNNEWKFEPYISNGYYILESLNNGRYITEKTELQYEIF